MTAVAVLQLVLALVLAANAFGRLIKSGPRTRWWIRHAFALLFAASLFAAGASARSADWSTVVLLAAMVAVQMSTSVYWRYRVPPAFEESS